MTTPNKNHLGKRVQWKSSTAEGYGTLMAVDCDESSSPHLVQREDDDDKGWILETYYDDSSCQEARRQGVKDSTPNLYWVSSYELIEDTMKAGDILTNGAYYMKVWEVLGEVVFTTQVDASKASAEEDMAVYARSKKRLEEQGWYVYQEPTDEADEMIAKLTKLGRIKEGKIVC